MVPKSYIFLLMIFLLSFLPCFPHSQTCSLEVVYAATSDDNPSSLRTWSPIALLYPDQYHNYSQLIAELQQIADTAPAIVDYYTIGQSFQGKDIHCLRITNEAKTDPKAGVFFVAHHHAREQITLEAALRFMHRLVNGYGTNQAITDYIDTQEIYIIPSLNPDSLQYVVDEGNAWLRKNLRTIDDDDDGEINEDPADDENGDGIISEYDIYVREGDQWIWNSSYLEGIDNDGDGKINEDDIGGVDLNRNYGYRWGDPLCDTGTGSDSTSETYPGSAPFSEPETQALELFMGNKSFATALSLHSGINATYLPWASEDWSWAESSLYYQIYSDFLELWPNLENYLGGLNSQEKSQKRHLPSYTSAGDWGDWMYAEKDCLVPMTFEIYHNASSDTQGQLLQSNTTHQLWQWDYIYEYFAPVEAAIEALWDELLPTFDYWLNITPRIEIESHSIVAGTKLSLNITNLSLRVGTIEPLQVLDANFEPLLEDGTPVTFPLIAAGEIENATIDLHGELPASLKIGNEYVGFLTLEFKNESKSSSKSSSWNLLASLLTIAVVVVWTKAKKQHR